MRPEKLDLDTESYFKVPEQVPFMNYANLRQTLLIKGKTSESLLENLANLVRLKNQSTEVIDAIGSC